MKLLKHNRYQIVLKADGKEAYSRIVSFDIDLLVPCRAAKWFRVEHRTKRKLERWEMPYQRLLRERCVGDIVLIGKDRFKYSEIPQHG